MRSRGRPPLHGQGVPAGGWARERSRHRWDWLALAAGPPRSGETEPAVDRQCPRERAAALRVPKCHVLEAASPAGPTHLYGGASPSALHWLGDIAVGWFGLAAPSAALGFREVPERSRRQGPSHEACVQPGPRCARGLGESRVRVPGAPPSPRSALHGGAGAGGHRGERQPRLPETRLPASVPFRPPALPYACRLPARRNQTPRPARVRSSGPGPAHLGNRK